MEQSAKLGAGVRTIDRFDPAKPTRFVAIYDDGTSGPEREDRERAEKDFRDANAATGQIRADIERYGRNSKIFAAWKDIHKDFKSCINGRRVCLAFDSFQGGTVLKEWRGPKALEV